MFSQEQAPLALFEEPKLGWSETFLPISLTRLEEEGETLLPWKLWEIGVRWGWWCWFPSGEANGCAENGRDFVPALGPLNPWFLLFQMPS